MAGEVDEALTCERKSEAVLGRGPGDHLSVSATTDIVLSGFWRLVDNSVGTDLSEARYELSAEAEMDLDAELCGIIRRVLTELAAVSP